MKKNRGFTLLEIMVVVVIIGILAAMAAPAILPQKQRIYREEAYRHLGATREALIMYHVEKNTFLGAAFDNIHYNPNAVIGWQDRHFTYSLSVTNGDAFTLTATRNTLDGGDGTSAIQMDQNGRITPTGIFA